MANEFRTVQYRGSDVQRNAYVGAPSGQQALDSNINYQNRQLQRSSESLLQQEAATIKNNERIDQLALQNERLKLEAMNSRNNAVLKNEELFGQQRLNNMKMREDQSQQIKQLQILHQQKSEEIKILNKSQEVESLTQFGQQMLQFSQTLWKENVKAQQKKAEEMEAHAVLDYALNPNLGEMLRVDQAQYGRLAKLGEASALANELEKMGLPNDAARIRAGNPFYLHTMQEMAILKGVQDLPEYLDKLVLEAKSSGRLNLGDPDYAMKLDAIQYDGLRTFLIETGISKMNPVVVARYLRGPMLETLMAGGKRYNSENNAAVKKAGITQAIGAALNAFDTLKDPVELNKHVSNIYSVGGQEGLDQFLVAIGKKSNQLGVNEAMVNLSQHPMFSHKAGDIAEWDQARIARMEANLKQQNQDTFTRAAAEWKLKVGRANPADLPTMREEHLASYEGVLSIEHFAQLQEQVMGTRVGDAGHTEARLKDIIELGDEKDILEARKNPALTNSQVAQLDKALEAKQKELSEPAQQALKSAQNLILGKPMAGVRADYNKAINPVFQKQVDAVVKERQDELARRSRWWWQNTPGATVDMYQAWLYDKNQDLISNEITVDQFGVPTELGKAARLPTPTRAVPTNASFNLNGRQVTSYLNQQSRQALIKGEYGFVDGGSSLLLSPQEIVAADQRFAQTGTYPPEIYALSARTRSSTPSEFLASQARLSGVKGKLSEAPRNRPADATTPASGGPGAPITRNQAKQYALNAGLSQRGAIWFASNIFSESGGVPTKTHDGGDGYGLFGHQGARLTRMQALAAQRGVDISDAAIQVEFALSEIKAQRSIWNIVSAPNPSLNDLYRASKLFFGFDEGYVGGDGRTVKQIRTDNLRRDLGE
jgi:hypothetical protein